MDPVRRAQNSADHVVGRPFEKGNPYAMKPGETKNPGGRPRKHNFTKICEKLANTRKGQKKILTVMSDILDKRQMAAVLLLREIAERTEGRVVQPVEVNSTIHSISDEELDAKLAKLFGITESSEDRTTANLGREAAESLAAQDSDLLPRDGTVTP